MDEGDGRAGQAVGRAPVESLPRVDHEDGSPAQEKEEDDDQEHADHAFLGHQVGCRAAAAHTAHHGLAAGAGDVACIHCDALLFRWLQVAAIAVTRLDAASAGLSVCQGGECEKKRLECKSAILSAALKKMQEQSPHDLETWGHVCYLRPTNGRLS